jgi:hypothetical protein
VARCNATHDSICERTTHPMAVISVWQRFRSFVDGETFFTFAMVYASSLPKAQLARVCDSVQCVECFQGMCPSPASSARLFGPVYELGLEIFADVRRLKESVDALAKTEFLLEIAQTTMAKLSEAKFSVETKVEYKIVCPDGESWDGKMCVAPSGNVRTWLGLGIVSVVLIVAGLYGLRQQKRGDAATAEEAAEILKCMDVDCGHDGGGDD